MTSQRVFETESVDVAAFIVTTGHEVTIYRNPSGNRAVFSFSQEDNLNSAIIAYERGAVLPAKRLLNSRSWLFREVSRVVREGGRI